jgi:hypothetical protein
VNEQLWDALREVACASKPFSEATSIVMLKKHHVEKALEAIDEDVLKQLKEWRSK